MLVSIKGIELKKGKLSRNKQKSIFTNRKCVNRVLYKGCNIIEALKEFGR